MEYSDALYILLEKMGWKARREHGSQHEINVKKEPIPTKPGIVGSVLYQV